MTAKGTITVVVPSLGSFTGKSDGQVAQFKNVPFGVIPARFKDSVLATDVGDCQCIEQGPICPQPTPYSDSILGVPEANVKTFELLYDEFKCLNLMITMPAVTPDEPIPVVVWIHGGSNLAGTAYRAVNDPTEWVRRSVTTGNPIIVVSIQFRVGLIGFLPRNGRGNFSLFDQQLGIHWTKMYISHFGGDPERMSLFGQSSGSFCAHVQSCVANPQFQQAAYLSGALRALGAKSVKEYQALEDQACEIIGIENSELDTCPWQDIVRAQTEIGIQVLFPVDDGHFLPLGSYLNPPKQLTRVLISDCYDDGDFFREGLEGGVLTKSLKSFKIPQPLLDVYKLDTDRQSTRLLTDYIFGSGSELADLEIRSTGTKVLRQLFDAINPLNPAFGNNHMVELFYGLRGYELPDDDTIELSNQVQDAWTSFAYLQDPWVTKSHFIRVSDQLRSHDLTTMSEYRPVRDYLLVRKYMPQEVSRLICGW